MENRKTVLKWRNLKIGILIFLFAIFFATVSISSINIETTPVKKNRPDIINIDSMKIFGELERVPVLFPHDLHTDAVEKTGQDCKTCHTSKNDKMSQAFKGWDKSDHKVAPKTAMDNFHVNCIQCHEETASKSQKTGPVVCADCHNPKPEFLSSGQPMGFDNSLHYRHSKAYDQNCATCHTDCKTDIYKKGEETTCRHCHNKNNETQTDTKVISFKNAAHNSCITCHMTRYADKKNTGPVKCSGCHDNDEKKNITKVSHIPRLDRKQPDMLFLKTGNKDLDESGKNRMDFVGFDHKAHENYNDTCRICHHESMSACNTCHTIEGSDKSKGVSLEQAMHKTGKNQSCTGCHKSLQSDAKCAGCHGFLSKNEKQDDALCLMCHVKPPEAANMDDATAKIMLEQRNIQTKIFDQNDIPDQIIIKEFSDKYEPVEFPHRQIINKIAKNIENNKLAAYFHTDQGTLCQGCHHNSPSTKKPSRCKNCHGKPFNEKDMNKPGIMGAYHIQCMECHTNMKIDKLGCTDCHKEKI